MPVVFEKKIGEKFVDAWLELRPECINYMEMYVIDTSINVSELCFGDG